jgi:ABC-2 type transport system ATP-binding protein
VLRHAERLTGMTTTLTAGIDLSGLTKSFGNVQAVRGVDLHIAPGETVALLGPNGAGKSTTIDMLLGLLTPDSGTVSVFGMSPTDAVAAGAVAAMLQTGGLIRFLTIRELVTTMASFYPNSLPVEEAMEITGVATIADQRTDKLSGGQTQRVRAAIALVANPDLLILDEPTVAMDVEGRHQFWTFMRQVASSGKTVIFATHYLEEADEFADRIVLLARGQIVADGPATEIKATVGLRTIKATLPGADLGRLGLLPGVVSADARGESIVLRCTDSDTAIRSLLGQHPEIKDIEIAGAGLEEAFLQLTGEDTTEAAR